MMLNSKNQKVSESKIVRQVAHDIRSPLSALNILNKLLINQISEETHELMAAAIQRLNDIAEDLLKMKDFVSENQTADLISDIEQVLAEKKIIHGQNVMIDFTTHVTQAGSISCKIGKTELQRLTSNLVNNAIEAFDGQKASVLVDIVAYPHFIELNITDSGKGMSQEVLEKLGTEGFSFGKKGTGLGFHHARSVLAARGGELRITSRPGYGTTVSIRIPC